MASPADVLATLTDFAAELRRAGLPVSLTESLDAARAVTALPVGDRSELRAALAATLVKSAAHLGAFDALFDVYFAGRPLTDQVVGGEEPVAGPGGGGQAEAPEVPDGAGALGVDAEGVVDLVADALEQGDPVRLRRAAALAVALFAGIEPRRPVGVAYYLARTLRRLGLDSLLEGLVEAVLARPDAEGGADDRLAVPIGPLGERLVRDEYRRRADELVSELEAEILRRLVAERGAEAVAGSVRRPLIEDVDVMHASRQDLAELRRALGPLARVLASRLARRRRHHRRGPLDFRATIRASMSTGGVPVTPRFHSPHPSKPELMVVADVSGSVAAFARFTLHLLYALDAQFSRVRSFVFIDGLDEVTAILRASSSLPEAVGRVASEAAVTRGDGHSDYGSAFRIFHERFAADVGPRTNLLVLGDARNNYHPAESWVLEDLRRRARRLYWLNPEPRAYWGSGDSIVSTYAPHCDAMVECRTLRQLESFVDTLA